MQTLWSRVAQVRATCRCPQCLNTANGVTRRATASATKRAPRYLYSSTLWYSGVFAVAATFDAARKERRKEQWDRVIAEVRQELEQPISRKDGKAVGAEEKLDDDVKESATAVVEEEVVEGVEYSPFGALLDKEDVTKQRQHAADEIIGSEVSNETGDDKSLFDLVDSTKPRPPWPSSTGPGLGSDPSDFPEFNFPPQSIYSSEWHKQRALLRRWTPKKLATVQKCTELLQVQFIRTLQHYGLEDEAAASVPDEYAKYITQSGDSLFREYEIKMAELLEIKAADAQLSDYHPKHPDKSEVLCDYTQDSLGRFHDTAREVNRSLRYLFKQRMQESLSQAALLAKLAYTLHLSPAPPNLDTFNTLLIGLIHVGEKYLAKKVVINMSESHIRTNEVSLVAELEYHTRQNDIQRFVRLVERLRGKHGGPMLARPGIRITRNSRKKTLLRVEVEGRRGWEERVIQLPPPTPMVFGAIIKGVLKFAGFESALSIVEEMGREGWGLCMAGLTPLLKECALRSDWTSGLAVWKQIQALKIRSVKRRVVNEEIGIEAFAAMLRLCTACDQQETFDSVWRQAMRTWERSMDKLVSLVKAPLDADKQHDEAEANRLSPVKDHRRRKVHQGRRARERSGVQSAEDPAESSEDADGRFWQQCSQSPAEHELECEEERHLDVDTGSFLPAALLGQAEQQPDTMQTSLPAPLDQVKQLSDRTQSETVVPEKAAESSVRVSHPKNNNTARQTSVLLSEQQLLGTYPAGHELDDYELRERPMRVGG